MGKPKANIKTVKMFMGAELKSSAKNLRGEKGEICNNCGGYGFTMKLGGGKLPCLDCKESGVKELTKDQLQAEVYALKKDIFMLRQALMKDLGFQGMHIPKEVKEATHGQQ